VIVCSRCGRENAADARFCQNCGNALAPAAPAQEVRKTVTIMFMDAVGSTSLGEQTDPESSRRLMTRYFDEIRTIVERHGGTVEKYIGDAVMAVFGVPVVHEDDALRAARAAVEIRSRLETVGEELTSQGRASVAWRTGINTGEVVAGDAGSGQRFVSGDAVNTAARLEQSAQAGEILIGQQTHGLVRDAIIAEATEPLSAKGKSEPLVAYRLLGLAGPSGQTGRRLEAPMIGRQRQRRLLAEAYEQAVDERVCHLFTILGAAGVGKSRLVAEFLGQLGADAQILHGRCLSYGEGITYWPIAEVVREAAQIADDDSDDVVLKKIGELVDEEADRKQVAERLGAILGRFTGAGVSEETFWAVRTLLESVARRRPLVLVLDDIHWAEPTLLDLIEHLADWTRDAPLLVLCVARHELLEKRSGWGGGKSYATTLTLEPLNEGESRELMVNLLGQVELSSELVAKIGAAAEGNPLFVEEMIEMLIDRGFLERRGDGWVAVTDLSEVTVPPTIQALLAARLDGLPTAERTVIERGSVEGKIFHRSAVAELAPAELRDSVPLHLRSLSRKELVRTDRSDFAGDEAFRFRHLLIRDAAYGAMPKEARADLHARFADWLERMASEHVNEYEEIIGYHLEQAYRYRLELAPLDEDGRGLGLRAGRHLGAAGQRAARRGDLRAATKLLTTATQLMPAENRERYRLIAELGAALAVAGELRNAEKILTEAMADAETVNDVLGHAQMETALLGVLSTLGKIHVEDVVRRTQELADLFVELGDEWGEDRATWELARHTFFAGQSQQAAALIKQRLAGHRPGEQPMPMLFTFLNAARYWGPMPVRQAMEEVRSMDISRSKAVEAVQLRTLGGLHGLVGEFETGRQMLLRSLELERELGRVAMASSVDGHFRGPLEHMAGNYEAAEDILLRAYEGMTATGDLSFSSTIATNIAALYEELGRDEEAVHYAQSALATSTPDDVDVQSSGRSTLALVLTRRGDIQGAEKAAREALEIAERSDYTKLRGQALESLATVLAAQGRQVESVAALRQALQVFEDKGATVWADRVRARLAEVTTVQG
jgi:class 3 adenylate cyclase/tetratricopeptide (TPR) repeat protein